MGRSSRLSGTAAPPGCGAQPSAKGQGCQPQKAQGWRLWRRRDGTSTMLEGKHTHVPCACGATVRSTYGAPEAGTRTAHVKCVEHRGQAARCLRYVQYAGGWHARPVVQRRPWDVISTRPGAKGAEGHRPPRVKGRRPRLKERLADDVRSQGQRTGRGNVSCQRRSIDRKEV